MNLPTIRNNFLALLEQPVNRIANTFSNSISLSSMDGMLTEYSFAILTATLLRTLSEVKFKQIQTTIYLVVSTSTEVCSQHSMFACHLFGDDNGD